MKKKKTKTMKTEKTDFKFKFAGYGHYLVTYTSPITQKQWSAVLNNMPLVNSVLHKEEPKRKDLESLKKTIKRAAHLSPF